MGDGEKVIVIGGQLSVASGKQVIDLLIFSINQKPRDKVRQVYTKAVAVKRQTSSGVGRVGAARPPWLATIEHIALALPILQAGAIAVGGKIKPKSGDRLTQRRQERKENRISSQ
jgi:hypothetical protein